VAPAKAIGTDTQSAMQSGIVLGYRAMTLGLLEQIRGELSRTEKVEESTIQVILTGGLSQSEWVRDLPGIDAVDPELTLKGLAILWDVVNGSPAVPGDGSVGWSGSAAGSIHIISEKPE
jgi:type III pantothenate kinase